MPHLSLKRRGPSREWMVFRLAIVQQIASPLTVSVAMCTHNGAQYVTEQLRSILHQTLPAEQVVVSDDASSDATVQTVRDVFARFRAEHNGSAPTLTLILNKEPLGVTANFEQATLACTGNLIALSDQDDVWVSERLERMVAQFTAQPDLTLLHSDARLVDGEGNPLGGNLSEAIGFSVWERRKIHDGAALDVLLRRNVVTGATTVFRRSLLDAAVPFPTAWVHDEWLAIIAAITGRVDFLPEKLTDYRQHASNQIGAAKLTLGDKVGRLREPRAVRNQRLLARAEVLHARVPGLRVTGAPNIGEFAARKVAHERFRSGLPVVRAFRLVPIVVEAASGAYQKFGRARYDMLRDLLQRET